MKNKKYKKMILTIFTLSIIVTGVLFVGVGSKSYSDSEKIARVYKPSKYHETLGYKSIDEWKESNKNEKLKQIGIGIVLIALGIGLIVIKKNKF